MAEGQRWIVYDAENGRYLAQFRRPVQGVDAAVTEWSANPERALRFRALAAARSAVAWMDRYECKIIGVVSTEPSQ